MRLNEVVYTDAEPVDGYGAGFFRIGGKKREAPLLTSPGGTRAWGGYEDVATLLDISGEIDVLFIGTGSDIAHIPAALRAALEQAGTGVEVMSSPAACRTYNVLLSEGRRVGLAVLPVT
ncbi:Mth938-like domain-containing protein [Marivita sp. GX14005]|uniref:Mth938-like domain-containing protein n=1 Tax=Marivita sp. GX14005 TaxID=2942276 RepID=UPI002019618B|nr:Mth938-like domain-containing protein [Marivita sp. GX14005]MCL3882803.1 Mth938-like domain-containing protein [Marivita sp. GX14005]